LAAATAALSPVLAGRKGGREAAAGAGAGLGIRCRRSLLLSLFLDHSLGLLLGLYLLSRPSHFSSSSPSCSSSSISSVISFLSPSSLPYTFAWLEKHPGGFKLNLPLTQRLSSVLLVLVDVLSFPSSLFFPLVVGDCNGGGGGKRGEGLITLHFPHSFLLLVAIGGGMSSLLALGFDCFRLWTLPIAVVFGVIRRLYALELSLLSSLWWLFRGRKKNILRGRVDSIFAGAAVPTADAGGGGDGGGDGRGSEREGGGGTKTKMRKGRSAGGREGYRTPQLLLGTLVFTIITLLFLTVSVYYFVLAGRAGGRVGGEVGLWMVYVLWRDGVGPACDLVSSWVGRKEEEEEEEESEREKGMGRGGGIRVEVITFERAGEEGGGGGREGEGGGEKGEGGGEKGEGGGDVVLFSSWDEGKEGPKTREGEGNERQQTKHGRHAKTAQQPRTCRSTSNHYPSSSSFSFTPMVALPLHVSFLRLHPSPVPTLHLFLKQYARVGRLLMAAGPSSLPRALLLFLTGALIIEEGREEGKAEGRVRGKSVGQMLTEVAFESGEMEWEGGRE